MKFIASIIVTLFAAGIGTIPEIFPDDIIFKNGLNCISHFGDKETNPIECEIDNIEDITKPGIIIIHNENKSSFESQTTLDIAKENSPNLLYDVLLITPVEQDVMSEIDPEYLLIDNKVHLSQTVQIISNSTIGNVIWDIQTAKSNDWFLFTHLSDSSHSLFLEDTHIHTELVSKVTHQLTLENFLTMYGKIT